MGFDAVVVLYTGLNGFVYFGNGASPEAEAAISHSARNVAGQRVSPCQLWKLRPGPDADFVLDTYLSRGGEGGSGGGQGGDVKGSGRNGGDSGDVYSAVERGFVEYCASLAPESAMVKTLRAM